MEKCRFIFIAETKTVTVDDETYQVNLEKIEPSNLRAIQWYGNSNSPWGEIEYNGENNQNFFDFNLIKPIYAKWEEAKKKSQEEKDLADKEKEEAESKYDVLRQKEYPSIQEQVGAIVSFIAYLDTQGVSITDEMRDIISRIQYVKDKYPKDVQQAKPKKKKNKK